ncbi:MAG TPA: DNA translocase FtsK [Acholeplasmataceae bacterium]|nr:DNA translocase FtsK [Acholeplasmataceae bacterium]HQC30196.1 DNA translocase FtsK [Acholeplasmataceae bacterium]
MQRRKKEPSNKYESKKSIFVIPQIVKIAGLRTDTKFKPTKPVSPIWGRKVVDVFVPEVKVVETGDVDTRYDTFRDEKARKISSDERSKYSEFTNIVTDESREQFLGSPVHTPQEEKVKTQIKEETIIKPIGVFKGATKPKSSSAFYDDHKEEKLKTVNYEPYKPAEPEPEIPKVPELDEFDIYHTPTTYSVEEALEMEQKLKTFEEPKVDIPVHEDVKEESEAKHSFKSDYKMPSVKMFSKKDLELDSKPEWLLKQVEIINSTLAQFQIEGRVINTKKGPTVTRYEIDLEAGINVKKISQIQDNLMMNLAASSIRIEAPIPGKPYVGIEVANEIPEIVKFGNVVDTPEFTDYPDKPLRVALGVDIDGENIYTDIQKMPHGLIAGATNSGKSVCVNTILVSLLLKNSPEDLRLILIDPKMVELQPYNHLPHLITPVITDAKMAATALKWVVEEMEKRFRTFAENRSRDIQSYNRNLLNGFAEGEKMPYIVIVIDELADLMVVAAQDVENSIQRITQKARAAGIHLLVATQRPTTDVVKGTIKANIPTRIAFRVAGFVDSATILDEKGAESLLGKGDMLFKETDQIIRLQGAWIPDSEIYQVTDFIRKHSEPNYVFQHEELQQKARMMMDLSDDLFVPVARFVVVEQRCSINSIQKEFSIGFNRAQMLVEALENNRIVSEAQGTVAREVLIKTIADLEEVLKNI